MQAAVKASISSHARPYTPHAIVAFAAWARITSRLLVAANALKLHAVSFFARHILLLLNIRAVQQESAPPGRLLHLEPLHAPQLAAQQIPTGAELGLCGSSSCMVAIPEAQSSCGRGEEDREAAAAIAPMPRRRSMFHARQACMMFILVKLWLALGGSRVTLHCITDLCVGCPVYLVKSRKMR